MYSNYHKQEQKIAYDNIGGFKDSSYSSRNEEYEKNQSDLLEKQQNFGIVPDHISKSSHGDLIGGLRYGINFGNKSDKQYDAPEEKYHDFNPYYNYLYERGVFEENTRSRITTACYTINSSSRQKKPIITVSNEINLNQDPLTFDTADISIGINNSKQNILVIHAPGHSIKKSDRITLKGLEQTNVSIKTIFNDINGKRKNAVVFTQGSTSVVFYCNFDVEKIGTSTIDTSMSFDPNFKIGNGLSFSELQSYDTSDMFVKITGFDISSTGQPYIGNIPINFLNSIHRIYFTNPDYKIRNGTTIYSPDTLINIATNGTTVKKITGFYIKLPVPYIGSQLDTSMTLTFTFNYIGGIPINKINAEFPIDENNLKGYHEVYSISGDDIHVLLDKNTHYTDSTNSANSTNLSIETQKQFGGSNIFLALVSNINSGYSNPNNYRIELPRTISDVVMIKMTSLIFPNTAKVFTNQIEIKNTKLYWQNQDDGDFIYNIELEPGNYTASDLEKILEAKIYEVKRKYSKISNLSTSYTDRNYMKIKINTNTNEVLISGFKEASLRKPIQDISPEIAAVGDGNPPYTLTISQSEHGLLTGDTVLFSGFVATSGIPTDVLNTSHVVVSTPTSDTYTIVIDNFNLLSGSRNDTGGGYASKAFIPSAFKLLFNYDDTMGNQLGFRKVGQEIAVTKFDTVISNFDAYQNETVFTSTNGSKLILDESGNKIALTCNSLKLSGYDYSLMVIRNLNNIINISSGRKITNCFAKVNLGGLPGRIIYDNFVCPPLTLYEPINLSNLDISFYTPDETLFDFDGIDHSFTLEITSIEKMPNGTDYVTTRAAF